MKKIDDGGPAFPMPAGPEPRVNAFTHYNEGMTLRDWFAGQALVGFQSFVRGGWSGTMAEHMAADVAANCYRIADAMIKASKAVQHD